MSFLAFFLAFLSSLGDSLGGSTLSNLADYGSIESSPGLLCSSFFSLSDEELYLSISSFTSSYGVFYCVGSYAGYGSGSSVVD